MRIVKLTTLLLSLLIINGCASYPIAQFQEEHGVACVQAEEQEKEDKMTCLQVRSFPDTLKWHRVKPYRSLPDIPDTP